VVDVGLGGLAAGVVDGRDDRGERVGLLGRHRLSPPLPTRSPTAQSSFVQR
jgi:hypothetical protein